jgi:hypothetical protein
MVIAIAVPALRLGSPRHDGGQIGARCADNGSGTRTSALTSDRPTIPKIRKDRRYLQRSNCPSDLPCSTDTTLGEEAHKSGRHSSGARSRNQAITPTRTQDNAQAYRRCSRVRLSRRHRPADPGSAGGQPGIVKSDTLSAATKKKTSRKKSSKKTDQKKSEDKKMDKNSSLTSNDLSPAKKKATKKASKKKSPKTNEKKS